MQYLKKNRQTPQTFIEGVLAGNKVVLSKAITLIESQLPEDQRVATEVMEAILPHSGKATRIGITGVPGVGKSTFIEILGVNLADRDHKVAVLAVDPSSKRTKGSIMGDKTRMDQLSRHPGAYIRPTATGSSLGGVAHHTRESLLLCEAAGYNIILVETVGVGQSETVVHSMVDFFLLLMLSGAGDELQGIKKGIIEMADALVITKADGDNLPSANRAKAIYENALHLLTPVQDGWQPPVMTCSALTNTGIDEIWATILTYMEQMTKNGLLEEKRKSQRLAWMYDCIRLSIDRHLVSDSNTAKALRKLEEKVKAGALLPGKAADMLLSEIM